MKTRTLALAISLLLGAAQWASAADIVLLADAKPKVEKREKKDGCLREGINAKGIKDPGCKGCTGCGITGKVAGKSPMLASHLRKKAEQNHNKV